MTTSKHAVHFSSAKMTWATPLSFFRQMEETYGTFDLDVCATAENTKCDSYISPALNALTRPWRGQCWMNPPYGRELPQWIAKAWEEVACCSAISVVCLIPARTDTAYWHDIIFPHATHIHFVRGRIKFEGAKAGAPFPSAVVVFGTAKKPIPTRITP